MGIISFTYYVGIRKKTSTILFTNLRHLLFYLSLLKHRRISLFALPSRIASASILGSSYIHPCTPAVVERGDNH